MSVNTLTKGQHVQIGGTGFLVLQKLPDCRWQLQNTATGEWRTFAEDDLLDRFAQNELSFVVGARTHSQSDSAGGKLTPYSCSHPAAELIALARNREQYLKEIDRQQPIAITKTSVEPIIRSVAERIKDDKPPGWLTLWRHYRRWVAAGRDVRVIIPRHADRGRKGTRMLPEVRTVSDQVIEELYNNMTPERRRVPEVHLEILRRVTEANNFRPPNDHLPVPSRRTIYREIARRPPYELMVARYGKHRANMEFRVSTAGPVTSHALERVVMDHTPSDIVVVDDNSMLPLGRPTGVTCKTGAVEVLAARSDAQQNALLLRPRDHSPAEPHCLLKYGLAFDDTGQKGLGPQEIGYRAEILVKCGKRLEFVAQFDFWKKAHPLPFSPPRIGLGRV
jgi:putative transposase